MASLFEISLLGYNSKVFCLSSVVANTCEVNLTEEQTRIGSNPTLNFSYPFPNLFRSNWKTAAQCYLQQQTRDCYAPVWMLKSHSGIISATSNAWSHLVFVYNRY